MTQHMGTTHLNEVNFQGDPVVLEASGDGGRLPPGGDVAVDDVRRRMGLVRGLVHRRWVAVVTDLLITIRIGSFP